MRVIVDRNIAARGEHIETLKLMEDSSVKLIRWENPEHVQWGDHCKMMVVDGVHSVASGMNPGDIYSHAWNVDGDYEGQKWRDTDVYPRGHRSLTRKRSLFGIGTVRWRCKILSSAHQYQSRRVIVSRRKTR